MFPFSPSFSHVLECCLLFVICSVVLFTSHALRSISPVSLVCSLSLLLSCSLRSTLLHSRAFTGFVRRRFGWVWVTQISLLHVTICHPLASVPLFSCMLKAALFLLSVCLSVLLRCFICSEMLVQSYMFVVPLPHVILCRRY